MVNKGWSTVAIRNGLCEKIDELVSNKVDSAITNRSQFVDLAIREYIDKGAAA